MFKFRADLEFLKTLSFGSCIVLVSLQLIIVLKLNPPLGPFLGGFAIEIFEKSKNDLTSNIAGETIFGLRGCSIRLFTDSYLNFRIFLYILTIFYPFSSGKHTRLKICKFYQICPLRF